MEDRIGEWKGRGKGEGEGKGEEEGGKHGWRRWPKKEVEAEAQKLAWGCGGNTCFKNISYNLKGLMKNKRVTNYLALSHVGKHATVHCRGLSRGNNTSSTAHIPTKTTSPAHTVYTTQPDHSLPAFTENRPIISDSQSLDMKVNTISIY